MNQAEPPIIEVRNLAYEIQGYEVLRDVSFQVHPGEVFGVMGMSGSGKSTLLKTLMGLIPASGGDIVIDGQSIVGLSEEELMDVRAKMGMCFQYAALFDSMTVDENVGFGLRRQRRLPEADIRQQVEEHLRLVGLYGHGDKTPAELSGGMRKRVGIARALIKKPKMLFYDEPSSGLDPIMSAVINELILHLSDTFGVTSLVVTHEVDELFGMADRVIMIHDGTVVACDTPAALRETSDSVVQQFVHGQPRGPIEV